MVVDRHDFENLSRSDCLALLAAQPMGRVAISLHALPAILPVSYCLLEEDVVFAAGSGASSRTIMHKKVIAFEADSIDPVSRSGWSVLVVGMARQLHERDQDWQVAHDLALLPWAEGHAVHLIRLSTDQISGRRLVDGASSQRTDNPASRV
ncbi:MAG: pyridoxamine 5'-phosphate oxidase family protein [Actinomycetota bacterium]|nr:pyridoxamine 5'-phosphate oxidase family protein [Actinomycetota bacterium]